MNPVDVMNAYLSSLEQQDWATFSMLLASDFAFLSSKGLILNKQVFSAYQRILFENFAPWTYTVNGVELEGERLAVHLQMTATDRKSITLPTGVILTGTGKSLTLPEEICIASIRAGQIHELSVPQRPSTLFEALGQVALSEYLKDSLPFKQSGDQKCRNEEERIETS